MCGPTKNLYRTRIPGHAHSSSTPSVQLESGNPVRRSLLLPIASYSHSARSPTSKPKVISGGAERLRLSGSTWAWDGLRPRRRALPGRAREGTNNENMPETHECAEASRSGPNSTPTIQTACCFAAPANTSPHTPSLCVSPPLPLRFLTPLFFSSFTNSAFSLYLWQRTPRIIRPGRRMPQALQLP